MQVYWGGIGKERVLKMFDIKSNVDTKNIQESLL